MRLVVEVPDKKLEQFRAAVESENRTQADVIRAAIDRYIAETLTKDDSRSHTQKDQIEGLVQQADV